VTFQNPEPDEIRTLLETVRHIAVVGLSPKTNRPSHQVARALQGFGYHIIPIRPAVDEVLGEKAYASLRDVPGPIDLVDVFRAPDRIGPIIDDCIAIGVKAVWLQDGVINEAEALRARAAGMTVVMNRCTYRDYRQLNVVTR
jgi:predicted CoA-binding protein